MTIHKIDAGLYVEDKEPEYHEFYCWSPDTTDGTPRTQWYIRDAADDRIVAGPLDLDDAIRQAAKMNKELEER